MLFPRPGGDRGIAACGELVEAELLGQIPQAMRIARRGVVLLDWDLASMVAQHDNTEAAKTDD